MTKSLILLHCIILCFSHSKNTEIVTLSNTNQPIFYQSESIPQNQPNFEPDEEHQEIVPLPLEPDKWFYQPETLSDTPQPEYQPEFFQPNYQPNPEISQPQAHQYPHQCYNQIVQSDFDSQLICRHHVSNMVIITQSEKGTIYRSKDGGITWEDIMEKFNSNTTQVLLRKGLGVYKMFVTSDNKTVYFLGNSGNFWMTRDGGETVVNYYNLIEFSYINPHPNKPDWLLGIAYSYCCWVDSKCKPKCALEAHYSVDGGETWSFVHSGVSPRSDAFIWGNTDHADTLTYLIYYPPNLRNTVLSKSFDFYKTEKVVAEKVIAMAYIEEDSSLLIAIEENNVKLRVSKDNAENFINARFPANQIWNTESIVILDTSKGSAFVGVQTNGQLPNTLDLYISDVLGSDFSLSLTQVTTVTNPFRVHFNELSTLHGVYWANHLEGNDIRSVISFNKGGDWFNLNPPTDQMCDGCKLHILGSTSNLPLHFGPEPTGTIIAHGNIGHGLSNDIKDFNLYVSQNAGLTWELLHNGTWVFSITREGNGIMLGYPEVNSNTVVFSKNFGKDWDECLFQDPNDSKEHQVQDIFSDLSDHKNCFWVNTNWVDKQQNRGSSLFFINMTEYVTKPPCKDDDYEMFTLHGPTSTCFLGKKISYTRKKPNSQCEPNVDILNRKEEIVCNCTRSDYYCTYCYTEKPGSLEDEKECIPDELCPEPIIPRDCVPGQIYTGPPRYRKIIGTECNGEIKELLKPTTFVCPNNGKSKSITLSSTTIIGIAISVVLIVALLVFLISLFKNIAKKQKISSETASETELKNVYI